MKRLTSVFNVAILLTLGALLITCTEEKTIVNPAPPAIDHIVPEIVWLSPQANAELSGDVSLTFTATDSGGIQRISLFRNGSSPADWQITPHTDSLYSLTWNTTLVDDGLYILEVRAWDESGNLGISPSLVVRVKNTPTPPPDDSTPPTILWLAPEPNAVVTDSVQLQFRVVDSSAIADVIIRKDGFSAWRLAVNDSGYYEYAWNSRADSDGVHLWEVWAWDAANNLGTSPTLALTVRNTTPPPPPPEGDHTPPDVWWESPDGGATLQDTVTLRVRVFDESGVDSVHLLKDGALIVSLPPRLRGGARGGEYEATYLWDTHADSDGVHLLSALAWDSAGNEGQSQALLVKVQNNAQPPIEDHTPPVIVWLSPEPGDTVGGTVFLQFEVLDDDRVDSVKVYLNGRMFQTFANSDTLFNYEVQWATDESDDGNYIFQVKAWDRSLNVGLSEVVWFCVWNDRPRVIWVPDDFVTIQGAVNASENGDTVRVRAGTYREMVYFWDKSIWLESEEGPERTIINAEGWSYGIRLDWGPDTTAGIRGFTIINAEASGIHFGGTVNAKILNNIIRLGGRSIWFTLYSKSVIRNNIFASLGTANVSLYTCYGVFENNLVIHSVRWAMWNYSIRQNPLVPDYCLFWDYEFLTNAEPSFQFGAHNLFDVDPLFENEGYTLSQNSPCIDSGNPNITDLDGTRSDMGAYGGPFAYPAP